MNSIIIILSWNNYIKSNDINKYFKNIFTYKFLLFIIYIREL